MVSDTLYDLCLSTLRDDTLSDEDKTDKIEELLSKEASPPLTGKALEDAVLGVLWRHRAGGSEEGAGSGAYDRSASPAPRQATIIRRPSPAPWQLQRVSTPGASSPRSMSSTFVNAHTYTPPSAHTSFAPPSFKRAKSSTASPSPFTSPKPSPRPAYATPAIPHSPSLSAYQFSDTTSPSMENYGDYGSDNVDWLVNEDLDASSNASYGDSGYSSTTNAGEYMQPYTVDMSPYDMLRSVLRDGRTDEELDKILEANGYDLSQTINSLMEKQDVDEQPVSSPVQDQSQSQSQGQIQNRTYLVGKSMSPTLRPLTPAGQAKSPIVCRYWLSTGTCARADCRFAHDVGNHVCKYWMAGNCLAGDSCMFSHDPTALMSRLAIDGNGGDGAGGAVQMPEFTLQDYDSFPALRPTTSNPFEQLSDGTDLGSPRLPVAQLHDRLSDPFPTFIPASASRSGSRPPSRHEVKEVMSSAPALHDDEAFPTLGSAASSKPGKRHHGKRGHGHHSALKDGQASTPPPPPSSSSMADIVRMTPPPSSPLLQTRRGLRPTKSSTGAREAGIAIPPPEQVPWLETGDSANRAYLKARAEAFRHGGLRNKFLQSAAQAWNRNDARGAKALSLRGQNENQMMKDAHREAAACLYEERNKSAASGKELYVDLHGLHPEEAVSYLMICLLEHTNSSRPIYAICGTGHHSKNGKDKVGKAVRAFLVDWRYAFREFSVPGDRNNVGGILGIDPSSYDKELASKKATAAGDSSEADSGVGIARDTKVRIVREEDARARTRVS